MKGLISLVAVALLFVLVSILEATGPSKPSVKMETSLNFEGEWEVDKEKMVTFSFKPLEGVDHKTNYPEEAQVVFDSGLTLVSGNSTWSGYLEKGGQYSITVILKPTRPGRFVIGGIVNSCLTKIFTKEEKKRLEEEATKKIDPKSILGQKGEKVSYPEKIFRFYNGTSSVVEVTGLADTQPDTAWHEDETGGVKWRHITIKRRLDELGPPPVLTDSASTPYHVPEKDSGENKKQSSTEASSPYLISGTFRYLNNWGNYCP